MLKGQTREEIVRTNQGMRNGCGVEGPMANVTLKGKKRNEKGQYTSRAGLEHERKVRGKKE